MNVDGTNYHVTVKGFVRVRQAHLLPSRRQVVRDAAVFVWCIAAVIAALYVAGQ